MDAAAVTIDARSVVSRRDISAHAAAEGWTQPQVARNVAHVVVLVALLGALGWASVQGGWLVRIAAWPVMAFAALGFPAMAHESAHHALFHRRAANQVAGTLVGVLLLIPVDAYAAFHTEHHAYTGRAKDPEGEPYTITARWELLLFPVSMVTFVANLWAGSVRTSLGRPTTWARATKSARTIRWGLLTHLVLYATAIVLVPWHVLVIAWLVPLAILILVITPYVLGAEHLGAEILDDSVPMDQLRVSRGIRASRLTRLVYRNHNFHHAHHFLPSVASRFLGEVSDLVAPAVPPSMWAESFPAFYRDLWRSR